MIEKLYKIIFGDSDTKKIKKYNKLLETIKEKEKEFENYNLDKVKEKTNEFKKLFENLDFKDEEDSKKIKENLESIKLEAFALIRHTTRLINWKEFKLEDWKKITWNMIPYDVQMIGWLCIHDWNISEMKTWEWKTLVATMPAYLNALTWNSVHIVTVNDYLAKRDASQMSVLYKNLWLSTWVITHDTPISKKKQEYKKDIVYATNNELGFDYLRDNMVSKKEDKTQTKLFFAIIDEVDSILIDEARTPLIISAPDNKPTSKYIKFAEISKKLDKNIDYKIDEKQKISTLTEKGIEKIEKIMWVENIYISAHYNDLHHIENAIKARWVYEKDKDYLVKNDEVMIIDEFTWRVLSGRRYSEWLHQAIEAKEWVKIRQESKTLASITFQNYFRLYWKLSGMTWTAKTEEEEFYKVYSLDTIVIPTNKPIAREDRADLLFKNEKGKFEYLLKLIKELNEKWQPILVWTVSVDKSEYLSQKLRQAWIKHNVLNAKQHDREAEVISEAGKAWAVTIATNMAWRWTDIKLDPEVKDLGWLIIIWTEKHETRRIDNQLRWRSGRQWDPGMTQFLVSPNDDIMRIFGWDKLFSVFNSPMFNSLPDDEPLAESSMLTKRVTWVQKQVEWHNFDIRKHVLEYDDVINKHREIIYYRRNKILDSESIDLDVKNMIESQVSKLVLSSIIWDKSYYWDIEALIKKINDFLNKDIIDKETQIEKINSFTNQDEISEYISDLALQSFESIKKYFDKKEEFLDLERKIVLQSIDELWMNHIDAMSKLKEVVAFEWYAQRQPLVVYKEKAFEKFELFIDEISYKTTKAIFSIDKNSLIEEVNMSENYKFNEDEIKSMLENFSKSKNDKSEKKVIRTNNQTKKQNPLFINPNPQFTKKHSNKKVEKKKIRV